MEMLLKDASAFSPRFTIYHSWHEPSPTHPIEWIWNEKRLVSWEQKLCSLQFAEHRKYWPSKKKKKDWDSESFSKTRESSETSPTRINGRSFIAQLDGRIERIENDQIISNSINMYDVRIYNQSGNQTLECMGEKLDTHWIVYTTRHTSAIHGFWGGQTSFQGREASWDREVKVTTSVWSWSRDRLSSRVQNWTKSQVYQYRLVS